VTTWNRSKIGAMKKRLYRERDVSEQERERDTEQNRTELIDNEVAVENRTVNCKKCKTKYLILYSGND
jgi:hypothetical protein